MRPRRFMGLGGALLNQIAHKRKKPPTLSAPDPPMLNETMPNLSTEIITPIVPYTACLQAGGSLAQLDRAEAMIAAGRAAHVGNPDAEEAFAWLEERIRNSRAQMTTLQDAS